jgi:CHAT domain-containing protein
LSIQRIITLSAETMERGPSTEPLGFRSTGTAGTGSGLTRDMRVVGPALPAPLSESTAAQDSPPSPSVPPVSSCPLTFAEEELALMRVLESLGARVQRLPAERQRLRQLFEEGNFDLLHIASHGEFGGTAAADTSAVLLEDGAFTVAELNPRMTGPLRACSPLVFFNTCHSARVGFSLTQLGAWGARLVHMGCGGFVGALWPVTDRAAMAFARAFYEFLVQDCRISEAILLARQRVREEFPDDPTWLAYRCFADPMARIEPLHRG